MVTDDGCKIDIVIEQYGLDAADPRYATIDEGLLARWKGADGNTPEGYRTLTEWFNKRLLKRVYDENGRDSLGARIDNEYAALTGGDDLVREEVIESLESDGLDPEGLRQDMVSWGTMRTHLLECLGGEKETRTAQTEWERESTEIALDYAKGKVEKALSSLSNKGHLDGLAATSIEVQIQLSCDECPTRVPLEVALERGYICEKHGRTAERTRPSAQ